MKKNVGAQSLHPWMLTKPGCFVWINKTRPFLEDVSMYTTVGRNIKWLRKEKSSTPLKFYYLIKKSSIKM